MKHRIAILSDIHGNTTALKAVLSDAKRQEATEYWLLGDIFLPGPGENDLLALLKDLPITATVRGNWDDCVLEALDGQYGLEDLQEVQLVRIFQCNDASFGRYQIRQCFGKCRLARTRAADHADVEIVFDGQSEKGIHIAVCLVFQHFILPRLELHVVRQFHLVGNIPKIFTVYLHFAKIEVV